MPPPVGLSCRRRHDCTTASPSFHMVSRTNSGRFLSLSSPGRIPAPTGVDGHGLPLAVDVASASPAEVKLVCSTFEAHFIPEIRERLIGDKAYGSDPLAAKLSEVGIELIAPNGCSRGLRRS